MLHPPRSCVFVSAMAVLLAVLLVPEFARAQGAPTTALSALASQRGQLKSTLKRSHEDVNSALKVRSVKLRSFQATLVRRERAAARLERLKAEGRTDLVLDRALREALVLDEEAQRARASLLAAEAEVARRGARLLELFDLVLAQQNQKIRAMAATDAKRRSALAAYARFAAQRAQVRKLLQPVLAEEVGDGGASLNEVRAAPTDDVETLLEKADLARDLEERFQRRAAEVRRRIRQLEQQRSLARATMGMVRESNLFGEDDYRPIFSGGQVGAGPQLPGPFGAAVGGAPTAEASADTAAAAPARGTAEETGAAAEDGADTTDSAPPPEEVSGEFGDAPVGADPGVGFDGDNNGARVEGEVDTSGGQTPDVPGGNAAPSVTVEPTARFSGLPTEQVYLGAGAESDARLRELIASDNLSLADLKRLEQKLLKEAKRMKRENKRIKTRLQGELKR